MNMPASRPALDRPANNPRVVSLLPSATELLAAIGGEGLLVGRSHECDFPASVATVPVLTAARTRGSPAEVDQQVSAALAAGESLYTLNEDLLAELAPDVILTQDLCSVCSIDHAAVARAAARLPRPPHVVCLNPTTLEGVLDDLLTVARAVGRESAGTNAMVALRSRLYAAEELVNPYAEGPVVGFLEWTDPLFCAGHWTVQMIERAGGRHPLNPTKPNPQAGAAAGPQRAQRTAGPSRRVTPQDFAAAQPQFIIVSPCGLGLEETRAGVVALAAQPWWNGLPAVRDGRVALVDGNQMFNRPGPRLVDAFEWLVGWLNERPGAMPAGFPWEPWGMSAGAAHTF